MREDAPSASAPQAWNENVFSTRGSAFPVAVLGGNLTQDNSKARKQEYDRMWEKGAGLDRRVPHCDRCWLGDCCPPKNQSKGIGCSWVWRPSSSRIELQGGACATFPMLSCTMSSTRNFGMQNPRPPPPPPPSCRGTGAQGYSGGVHSGVFPCQMGAGGQKEAQPQPQGRLHGPWAACLRPPPFQ